MEESHLNNTNAPLGGIDTDSDLTRIAQTDFLYALNIRNGLGGKLGAATNVKGNIEIQTNLLPNNGGINTCIGYCEDKRGVSGIYFVHNSLGEHCILRYYPQKTSVSNPNGTVETLLCSSKLNFSTDWLITHAHLVDSKLLYWTDAYTDDETIEGNPPRKINVHKANVTSRELCFEVHARDVATFFDNYPIDLFVVRLEFLHSSGGLGTNPAINPNDYIGDPEGFLEFIANFINTDASASQYASAEYCECKLTVKTKPQVDTTGPYESSSTLFELQLQGSTQNNVFTVPIDHYPFEYDINGYVNHLIDERHIEMVKRKPVCEPRAEYNVDVDVQYKNKVNQNLFQFRTRYWYDDGEKSAWSPISIVPLPLNQAGDYLNSLNVIDIDYTEDVLNDPNLRGLIVGVEIAVREGNDGPFKRVEVLDMCEIGIDSNIYKFYNNTLYQTVPSDDNSLDPTVQVLKNFDAMPLLSGTMEFVSDRNGNSRAILAANLENYDAADCVELSYVVEDDEDVNGDCLVTIRGTITVWDIDIDNEWVVTKPNTPEYNNVLYDGRNPVFVAPYNDEGWIGKQLNGFVVYLAGTPYFAVSDNPNGGGGTGEFEIRGVPKDRTYIMRVASYLCTFDNTNGPIHNLNNGLEWQKTSAPVIEVAGSSTAHGVRYERVIDLTGFGGSTFDLDTEVGFGEIKMLNCHNGERVPNSAPPSWRYDGAGAPIYNVALANFSVVEMYIYDNNAEIDADNNDYDVRRGGIGVELQVAGIDSSFSGVPTPSEPAGAFPSSYLPSVLWVDGTKTDHNGYAVIVQHPIPVGPGGEAADEAFVTTPIMVSDVCSTNDSFEYAYLLAKDGVPTTQYQLGDTANFYYGGLAGLSQGNLTPILFYADIPLANQPSYSHQVIAFNKHQDFTKQNKTTIEGTALDSLGLGVQSVLVNYEKNGRQEKTNINGNYSIAVYCAYNSFLINGAFSRESDRLFYSYLSDVCYNYPPTPTEQTPIISEFCANPYDFQNPYAAVDVVFPFVLGLIQTDRYLKTGGVYRWGVVYEDEAGRQSTVVEAVAKLEIPYFTEKGSYSRPYVKWSIDSPPPDWATTYRIVRTNEGLYRRYFYWVTEEVLYTSIDEINSSPAITDFANADASHIMIRVPKIISSDNQTDPVNFFFAGTNNTAFEAQPKDRIRFISDETGAILGNGGILDFEIVGTYVDGDNYYVVIEDPELFQEIKENWLIEIYSPKDSEELAFFEVGECLPIIDAKTINRRHGGRIQDQIIGTQPATGYLVGGDTYWRRENFPVSSGVLFTLEVEHSNVSDRYESEVQDIGRVNIVDDDFGQKFHHNIIRFGGVYVPNTKVNNLSSFRSGDFIFIDQKYGIIKKLVMTQTLMLAICQFKIQPIYVGKDNIMDLSNRSQVGKSNTVLNIANELREDFGTHNPESIALEGSYVYGWDVYQGVVWRYAPNGLHPISDYGNHNFFEQRGTGLLKLDRKQTKAFGVFDRTFGCYLLSFKQDGSFLKESDTISFLEGANKWNTFLSYTPEYFGNIGGELVSFLGSELWLHESNDVPYNNFYGVQYTSRYVPVFNMHERAVKLWHNIDQQATKLWFAELIEIPSNEDYLDGMRSELLAHEWSLTEGIWKADFLRDMNDTKKEFLDIAHIPTREVTALYRGRPLRGEVLVVHLALQNSSEFAIFRRVDVEFSLSNDTKP